MRLLSSYQRHFAFPGCFLAFLQLVLTLGPAVPSAKAHVASPVASTQVEIGFDGIVKLGKWTPIFIHSPPRLQPARFEIATIDGDNSPVTYTGELLRESGHPNKYQAWVRFGRTVNQASLVLRNASGEAIETIQLSFNGKNQIGSFHDSTRDLILTIESDTTLADAISSTSAVADRDQTRLVIALNSNESLPLNWIGYDSVKAIVMVTSDIGRIRNLSKKQLDAIEAWIQKGGTFVFSVAKNGPELLGDNGLLQRFSPGQFDRVSSFKNSKRLESYAESREQLIPIRGVPIPIASLIDVQGFVAVADRTGAPLVVRRAFGMGQIVFTTFDLDSNRLTQWKSYPSLTASLLSGNLSRIDEQKSQHLVQGNSVSHFGFQDLIGQLRVPLDQFTQVRFVTFAWIALLIGVYILCIGPGDYFFLRHVFGKMELTWITFPLVSLLFCGLAIGISRMTRPNTIQLNQLEIIDIDAVENRTRGSVWTNVYSPSGETTDIGYDPRHDIGFSIDSNILSWHGLPGTGLGGMRTKNTPGLLKSSYTQNFELSENGQDWHTSLDNMPLQVSSTRALFGQWWADNPFEVRSRLRHSNRINQTSGTIKNPFDFTLHNCRLVFQNTAYVFNQPLGPGQTIDIRTEANEKALKNLLTRKIRQTEKNDRSRNSPWDIRETRLNRIADMMMFYQAAGGETYTGLTHDYQGYVDLTEHLDLNRAILVGEAESAGCVLTLDGKTMANQYDKTVTIIRIVLPVQINP